MDKGVDLVGAVRIYKDKGKRLYPWQLRVDGCTAKEWEDCVSQHDNSYLCNAYMGFEYVLDHLNGKHSGLGRYISK